MKRKDLGFALHKDSVWFSFQSVLDFKNGIQKFRKLIGRRVSSGFSKDYGNNFWTVMDIG